MTISFQNFGQQISALAKDPTNKAEQPFGKLVSSLAHEKKNPVSTEQSDINRSILESSLSLSESRGDTAMALLYKTALEGINEELKSEFGDNAIQQASEQGVDVSPQATADRIVQMSTSFFSTYYDNHQDMSLDEALSAFSGVIGSGIDKGFSEARDILGGLNVLEGDVASNIDTTYGLVQQGLQAFIENYSAQ